MKLKVLPYTLIYSLPILVGFSFLWSEWKSFIPIMVYFGLVPLFELVLKPSNQNFSKEENLKEKRNPLYLFVLLSCIPLQFLLLYFFVNDIKSTAYNTLTFWGHVSAMGLACGVLGINIGHELGHRNNRFLQFLGELLLWTSLNTHFLPYHNAGHHAWVGTKKDPATARKNEPLYIFWLRSHFGSYYWAWKLEATRLKRLRKKSFNLSNRMVTYTIGNIVIMFSLYYFFNIKVLFAFLASAIIGILLLETVNYIEHYGLTRKQTNNRLERVKAIHSWNSDHLLGRTLLFNLSRHSDHHYNGSKPYQLLKSHEESPQLPTGYPGMMLLALVPFLWTWKMNKLVAYYESSDKTT